MKKLFNGIEKTNKPAVLFVKAILLLLFINIFSSTLNAQYPVRALSILKPPYSTALSDYYTGSDEKLKLMLTNIDLREPLIRARLQLNIISNKVVLRSRPFTGPIIDLDAGVPNFLSGMDLAVYFNPANIEILSGLDYNALFQKPRLPDGTYQFRFDVIDIVTGRLLSDVKAYQPSINIISSDPPFLNLPRKGDNLRYTDPLNIIFNWTPRALIKGITEYQFSLYEVQDNGIQPENTPYTSQPIYQTTVNTTTFLYGATEPPLLPGKKYAWRVQAVAKQGGENYSIYNNDGYTETFWFQLQDNCDPIRQISATVRGGAVTLEWPDNPAMFKYTVEYRKKGNDWNRWFNTETNNNKVIITDVAPGNSYEYRVGGICTVGAGATFSDIRVFTIPPRDSLRDKQCGILPNINLSNQNPLQNLSAGETVMVGDYPATILSILPNGNSSFSGTAAIRMNIFNIAEASVKASFNTVVFNTDKQLIKGFMVTTYDSTEKQIADLDEVFEGGRNVGKVKTGLDSTDITLNFPVNKPEDIKVTINPDGTAIINITGANGETKKITTPQLPTTIKDSEGNIYNVDKNGQVTKIGKAGEFKGLDFKQFNTIATDKATVSFTAHPKQQYAFDQWKDIYNKSQIFKAEYQDLNGYRVSSKAIEAAKTDLVKATITIKDNSIKPDSVRFVTSKGTRYESKYVGNNEYEVTLVGGPAGDAQELYPIYATADNKYVSFGKLLIVSYTQQKQKLVLIPVNGASVDKNKIAQELNAIYNPIGVEWNVQQDVNFSDNTWDKKGDGLDVDGSGLFSTLTDDMKALNNTYRSKRSVDKSTIYLFVLSKASQAGVVGDMPRNKQFGYLFSNDGKVAAHEVGHGLFNLKHSFDSQYGFAKGELAGNVMDYPNGDQFSKLQWNAIHAPGLVIGLFEGDGDGQSKLYPSIICINDINTNKFQSSIFSDPDGNAIDIGNAKPYAFYSQREEEISIRGRLAAFKKNGKIYGAWLNKETYEFAGYAPFDIDPKKFLTYVLQLPKGETSKVQIVEGSGDNCEIKIKVNNNEVGKFIQDACTDCPGLPQVEGNMYRGKEKSGTKNGNGTSTGGTEIKDYSKKLKPEELQRLQKLFGGKQKITDAYGVEAHTTKLVLFITDGQDNLNANSKEINAYTPADNELAVWLHLSNGKPTVKFVKFGNVATQKQYEQNLKDLGQENDYWTKFFEGWPTASLDDICSVLYEGLDWLGHQISKARIPEYVWNCTHPDYKPIYGKVFNFILKPVTLVSDVLINPYIEDVAPQLEGKIEPARFAMLCGVWNGLVDAAKAIPDGLKLLTSAGSNDPGKRQELEVLKGEIAKNGGGFSGFAKTIWYGIKETHDINKMGPCGFAHTIGSDIFMVLAAYFTAGESLTGTASGQAVKTVLVSLEKLDVIGRVIGKATGFALNITFKGGQKVLKFVIPQGAGQIVKDVISISKNAAKYRYEIWDAIANTWKNIDWGTAPELAVQNINGQTIRASVWAQNIENFRNGLLKITEILKDENGQVIKNEAGDIIARVENETGQATIAIVNNVENIFSKFSKTIDFGGDIVKTPSQKLNILGRVNPKNGTIGTKKLYDELIAKGVPETEITGLFQRIPSEWNNLTVIDMNTKYWNEINKVHIDNIIQNGGDIRFIHDPRLIENQWNYVDDIVDKVFKNKCISEGLTKIKTFMKMEYDYLISKGYILKENGLMIKP